MPEIVEPLSPVRLLKTPKKFAPLKNFSAGRRGNPWEQFINDWARATYLGRCLAPQVVAVLEDNRGKLIGVGSFRPKPMPGSDGWAGSLDKLIGQSQCIYTVAIDRFYRGERSADGLHLGDLLLAGIVDQVESYSNDRTAPMWALINPENRNARALFHRNNFQEMPYFGRGDITYARQLNGNTAVGSSGAVLARSLRRLLGKAPAPPPAITAATDAATPPRPA